MELAPAYGRDYKSAAEAEAAFRSGKDWLGDYSMGFKPCGISDFPRGSIVKLYYCKNRKFTLVKV